MREHTWWVLKLGIESWGAFDPEANTSPHFTTWQEAFDHAFKEATRELSDR